MSILNDIKLKTQQVAMKTDEELRKNGAFAGICLASATVLVGLAGVAAMAAVAVPGAVVAAPIAAVAALSSTDGASVLGVTLNLAGSTMLGGGLAGTAFAAFSQLYKKIRNTDPYHDTLTGNHYVKCVQESGKIVEVPSMKFYEMVEKDTLKNNFKEVIADVHLSKGIHEERRYLPNMTLEQASTVQGEPNCEKIRRLLFKETKNMDFAANLSEKIKNIREKFSNNNLNTTAKPKY